MTTPKPRTLLIVSTVWILCSILFLDVAWHKVTDLRAANAYISPFRYFQVVFWVAMLCFWIWNTWQNWRRFHAIQSDSQ